MSRHGAGYWAYSRTGLSLFFCVESMKENRQPDVIKKTNQLQIVIRTLKERKGLRQNNGPRVSLERVVKKPSMRSRDQKRSSGKQSKVHQKPQEWHKMCKGPAVEGGGRAAESRVQKRRVATTGPEVGKVGSVPGRKLGLILHWVESHLEDLNQKLRVFPFPTRLP